MTSGRGYDFSSELQKHLIDNVHLKPSTVNRIHDTQDWLDLFLARASCGQRLVENGRSIVGVKYGPTSQPVKLVEFTEKDIKRESRLYNRILLKIFAKEGFRQLKEAINEKMQEYLQTSLFTLKAVARYKKYDPD